MNATKPAVTLVRHGETTWSRNGQHTSRTDLELTEVGEAQARAAQVLIGTGSFDLVLTSPLERARRTAEIAGLTPFEVVDDLREWDYGDLEGRTTEEIRKELPGWSIWQGPWPGGETPEQVGERADRVIARLQSLPSGDRAAVVAHGHILRVLGARWVGAPVIGGRWLGLDTAAVCHLAWEHEYPIVQHWNLTASA